MGIALDLTGKTFGRLEVIKLHTKPRKREGRHWDCICSCGNECVIHTKSLRNGDANSCGCLKRELMVKRNYKHGNSVRGKRTRTYESWADMMKRCTNKNAPHYSRYGGRGIKVCERWLDFTNFLEDMGECPEKLTLERKDSDGNYEPDNCIWADRCIQAANRGRRKDNKTGFIGVYKVPLKEGFSFSVHLTYRGKVYLDKQSTDLDYLVRLRDECIKENKLPNKLNNP